MISISRQDCLDLIYNKPELLTKVYTDFDEVLKYIKDEKLLDIIVFYNMLRVNYNDKKSKVYINIMHECSEPKKVLTTLSALVTQILLFCEHSNDKEMFMKHARYNEILKCLSDYSEKFDLTSCIDLIKELKTEIKYFENI